LIKESRLIVFKRWLEPYIYAAIVAFIGVLTIFLINNFYAQILVKLFWFFFATALILNFFIGLAIISTLSSYYKNYIEFPLRMIEIKRSLNSKSLTSRIRRYSLSLFDIFIYMYLVWSIRALILAIYNIEFLPTINFIFQATIPDWVLQLLILIGYDETKSFLENIDIFFEAFWIKLFSTALIFWSLSRNGIQYVKQVVFENKDDKNLIFFLIFGIFGTFSLALMKYSDAWSFLNIIYLIGVIFGGMNFIRIKYIEKKYYIFGFMTYIFLGIIVVWFFYLINKFSSIIIGTIIVIIFLIIHYLKGGKKEDFEKKKEKTILEQIIDKPIAGSPSDIIEVTLLYKKTFKKVEKIKWDDTFVFKYREPNITGLGVYDYNLTYIPKEIENLSSLEELYLIKNKIREIPDSLGKLEALKNLYLNDNEINNLPESIGNLKSLEILRLGKNHLKSLPKTLIKCKKIKSIDLSANNFNKIPLILLSLENLEKIEFRENSLRNIPECILNQLEEKNIEISF